MTVTGRGRTGTTLDLPVGSLPPQAQRLRDDVVTFLADELRTGGFTPRCDAWMSAADPAFSRRLADRGWVGMTVPSLYGGHGRSPLERFVVAEELLAAGAPVAAHWIADRQMAPSIQRLGTEEQKHRYLPAIARGECFFAIGMSEPDAGSDLAAVRTRAREVPGGWEITGTKLWTTGAHLAHAIVLLARTDPAEGSRHAGLSQLVVDLPWPGVTVRPIRTVDGEHHFNEVVLDAAVLPSEALLGTRGGGWEQVTAELAHERSGPERLLSTMPLLVAWADALQAEGGDPPARREVGRLLARAWTVRQMSLAVATALADGKSPAVTAALVKDLGSRFEGDVVETVRRLRRAPIRRGAADGVERLLRDGLLHSPAFTLRGGATEILRSVVAGHLGVR